MQASELLSGANVPLAHSVQAAAPVSTLLALPGGHGVHAAAPVEFEYVPSAQGVAFTEPGGQAEPAGQGTGWPDAQKKDAGHWMQASWRTRLFVTSPTASVMSIALKATLVGLLKRAFEPKPSA